MYPVFRVRSTQQECIDMASHKHGLMVNITNKRGLHVYFTKKASGRNLCIADAMRGKGGSRTAIRQAFAAAAKSCK